MLRLIFCVAAMVTFASALYDPHDYLHRKEIDEDAYRQRHSQKHHDVHRETDCIPAVLKVCAPHSEPSHRTWQTNQAISRLYRCMVDRRSIIHRSCHHFVDAHASCVDDIERLCPNMILPQTIHCIEGNHVGLSHKCKESPWYKHQFPHDRHRQSHASYHEDIGDPEGFGEFTAPEAFDESEADL